MEKEYELHSTVETDRAVIRIYLPMHETKEEKEAFKKECIRVNRKIATRMYKDGELNLGVANN